METIMRRRWIVLALIGMVALGANPESLNEKVRRLEAENKLLKAQVASLKRKLAANQPAASQPSPTTKRPPKGKQRRKITFTLIEKDPVIWRDVELFNKQMALRLMVTKVSPNEAIGAWLARHDHFAGQKVAWKVHVERQWIVTEQEARRQYRKAEQLKEKIESQLKAVPPTETDGPIAQGHKETIAECLRDMAYWKVFVDSRGGAAINCRPHVTQRPEAFDLRCLASPAKAKLMKGGRTLIIGGTIISAKANPHNRFKLSVTLRVP